MSHYIVILHAVNNLNFSFTINFTLIVTYNFGNDILTSKLKINNIYMNSLKSINLSVCLSI